MVRGAGDVLEKLFGPGARPAPRPGPALELGLAAILDLVERGHATADAIALAATRPPAEVAAALTRLELLGYLSCSGGLYATTGLSATRP